MMIHAMRKALQIADSVGIIGLFVDAKDEAASHYYRRFGFIALPDSRTRCSCRQRRCAGH